MNPTYGFILKPYVELPLSVLQVACLYRRYKTPLPENQSYHPCTVIPRKLVLLLVSSTQPPWFCNIPTVSVWVLRGLLQAVCLCNASAITTSPSARIGKRDFPPRPRFILENPVDLLRNSFCTWPEPSWKAALHQRCGGFALLKSAVSPVNKS